MPPSVVRAVLDNAKPIARLSVVALHYDDIPVSFLMVLMKQFTICGAMEYPARFEAPSSCWLGKILAPMITHRYSLDRLRRTRSRRSDGSRECGKVMITISEERFEHA